MRSSLDQSFSGVDRTQMELPSFLVALIAEDATRKSSHMTSMLLW
jgi:hypothetical protein